MPRKAAPGLDPRRDSRPRPGSLDFLEDDEARVRPGPVDVLGDNRLPTDLLPYLAEYVEEKRSRNQDIYIAVTGREGHGKSSLGLTAALELEPDLPAADVILDREDYYRVYDPDAKDEVYVFDEAARLLFNREWHGRHQRGLVKEIIENRKNRNTIFLHLPQLKTLDKYVREGRIDLWFACTSQGSALVRKLSYNAYEEEAYYPIVIDEHRWEPLETSHPGFAEAYYDRKDDAHSQAFHQRKREIFAKEEEDALDREHRSAKRQDILEDGD